MTEDDFRSAVIKESVQYKHAPFTFRLGVKFGMELTIKALREENDDAAMIAADLLELKFSELLREYKPFC